MMSLAVDLRNADRRAVPSPLDYMFYVTFWPQLIAGPITRGHEILPQLKSSPRITAEKVWQGTVMILLGLFYKSAVADGIAAPIANKVFDHSTPLTSAEAWAGAGAFAVQIYGDFFGYTSCAIGVALCLGYQLPQNFLAPYGAAGFSDFWRRWHISLSRWIRDYVYQPMGGDRQGRLRTSINLLATMSLAGLWHGAGWNYILWGTVHGLLLAAERQTPQLNSLRKQAREFARGAAVAPPVLWCAVTFIIIVALWVPFRAPTLAATLGLWSAMALPNAVHPALLPIGHIATGLILMVTLFLLHMLLPRGEANALLGLPRPAQVGICAILLALFIVIPTSQQPFIYFQF